MIAARFHNTLVSSIGAVCEAISAQHGLVTVALSGGVFQNEFLWMRAVNRLEMQGILVLTHHRVPTNDGGVSFGQAAVAAARAREYL
jgi:hydrogenase maturation protein HypF